MKNKKRLLSLLAVFCAFVLIVGGVLAFFSDNSILDVSTKIGTLDIDAEGNITHSGGLDNLNPGDNDPTVSQNNRNGNDHEISFTVDNLGTKSAITRAVIHVYGTGSNGEDLTEEELSQIIISERNDYSEKAADTDKDKYTEISNDTILDETKFSEGKLVYIVGNNNDWVLDGSEEDETVGKDKSLSKTFDVGLKQEVGNFDKDGNIQYGNLEGATIHIDIEIQAIQYRNTGDPVWETIFKDSTTTTTPAEEILVEFDFVKNWENDTLENRPDEITVEIYGTTNARVVGELLKTETIKVADDLDKDGDPNTWEYTISGIETSYRNFYMIETSEDDRYEVTENFITPATNERIRPYAGVNINSILTINKTWEDNDNELGLRPESVMFNVYIDNETEKELFITLEVFENDYNISYLNPDYSLGGWESYVTDWNAVIYLNKSLPGYMSLEEINVSNNYSMSYTFDNIMGPCFEVTNTLENTEPPKLMMRYNAILTNTFVE